MKAVDILNLSMGRNGLGVDTIRDYLKELLLQLWYEGEGFSGKRPFGNSGWEYELYTPLIAAKVIDGELDENGCVSKVDKDAAHVAITSAIEAL